MSTQKGNSNRSRPQKYQNSFAFKNSLHDTSHKTKFINNLQIVNVCERCKKIIEWKIKYKKYKPLKNASTCTKCHQKCVKHAYHIMCGPCANQDQVCPKCGQKEELIEPEPDVKSLTLDRELKFMLKKLPERKRRTFLRYMKRKAGEKKKSTATGDATADDQEDSESDSEEPRPLTRDDLVEKLNSLLVTGENCDESSDESSQFEESEDDLSSSEDELQ